MFQCNLCQPARDFESEDAYNIHKTFHIQSEQEVVKELEDKHNSEKLEQTYKKLEEVNDKMEIMNIFKKDEQPQLDTQPNIVRQYLYELHLEVIETKDKKFMKVVEEINKKLIELMNDNYDVVVKHQKTEKQF